MVPPLLGRTIAGKFLIESLVGEGGMGSVYRARQIALDKTVAVKIMHAENASVPTFTSRFEREARAASRLDHPNSVRVIDFGQEPDGLLYLAMEFLEGRDLYSILEEDAALPPERIVSLLSQVLAALAAAHEAGIVHRDLKPENIMVLSGINDDGAPRDVVKVCDFGIARLAEVEEPVSGRGRRLTGRGIAIGTPEYMSPEQAMGDEIDARSDLYSVGVILFQLLTRTLPFESTTPMGVALKHVSDPPPSILALAPDAHPGLVLVCERAMQKKASERYQTARELRTALRRAIGATVEAAPTTVLRLEPTPTSFWRVRRIALGVVVLTALLMVYGGLRSTRRSPMSPNVAQAAAASIAAPPSWSSSVIPDAVSVTPASSAIEAAPAAPPSSRGAKSQVLALPRQSTELVAAAPPASVDLPAAAPASPLVVATAPPPEPAKAATPAATPPSAPAPPPPALDLTTARVTVGAVSTTNALPATSVRSAVSRADFVGCYRAALKAAGAPAGGTAILHIQIDSDGYITSARAGGAGFLGAGASCLEARVRGLRVPNVDTGDASADVTLVFAP